jgi:hypothetical protein
LTSRPCSYYTYRAYGVGVRLAPTAATGDCIWPRL